MKLLNKDNAIELELANEIIGSILDGTGNAVFVLSTEDFTILYANKRMSELVKLDNEIVGMTCHEVFKYNDLPCLNCPMVQVPRKEIKTVKVYSDLFDSYMFEKISVIKWVDGKDVVMCSILNTDELISNGKSKKLEIASTKENVYKEKLRLSGELYSTVVAQIKTIVFEYNYIEGTSYVSPLFEEKFGISSITNINFAEDNNTRQIIYDEDIDVYNMLFNDRDDNFREVTCRFIDKHDNVLWYKITIQIMRDADGTNVRAIGTIKDVDTVTRTFEELRYRADYDVLTGLPNSARFFMDAARLIQDNPDEKYAIVVFDVEKFKMINDLFDMNMGDRVLVHIGDVLRTRLPEEALYARIHSDVFCMCYSYRNRGDVIKQIEKIRKVIYINDFSFDVNTSYGIYLPDKSDVPINLMCDRAMLAGKTVKGNVLKFCAFYDEQYRENIIKNREIEQDMVASLADNQFKMYLQPKFSLKEGTVVGAEVLARWQHPVKGLIMPNDFIPLFEKNGFILKLDEYMWEQACIAIKTWIDSGRKPLPLAVNISRYHIKNNDIVKVFKNLINKYNLTPDLLILEITESVLAGKEDEVLDILTRLQSRGFHIEVDDFGSGYSSLSMLRNVPINTIKIDRNFLDKKLSSRRGKIVVSHTIAMAKDLNLGVIAEGVETKEHVEFLQDSNCDIAQGFFFAKPMTFEEFNQLDF